MGKLEDVNQLMQQMEQVGFPKNDRKSALKLMFLSMQLEKFGFASEEARSTLLRVFHNDGKANSQNFIEIFRQSDINGSYFNFKEKIKKLKIGGSFFGFNTKEFIEKAKKKPELFFVNPDNVIAKVNLIHKSYSNKGFTGHDFFKIGCEFPSLLANDPKKIEDKIETLHDFFASYGVEWKSLFTGIKKQSRLLSVDPKTVITHAKILLHDHRHRYWSVGGKNSIETDTEALTAILETHPIGLNFSDENLKMRRIYAMVVDKDKTGVLKLSTYLRNKKSLEPILRNGLVALGRHSLWDRLKGKAYFNINEKE